MTTRLSSPTESLKNHYPVVVVGSGYGGGIAASRLARAGQQVCLLERGREFQPGEYPDTEREALEEIQIHSPEGHLGSRLGLFDLNVHPDINAVVGCGLGGTSLINANVSLRAVPRVWEDPRWPAAVRADLAGLIEDGYRAAEAMLRPKPYPDGYPALAKLDALKRGAAAIGSATSFYRPPINVTFADGPSPSGVPQKACCCCGDCVSGCNYGAKNTTLMNYLPDAWNFGAEIFTQVAVTYLERQDGKWVVHYELPGAGRELFNAPDLFLTADLVVLSAGTLGSTEILLRSQARGLPLSDRVGYHFSGNGDVLAFAYDCDQPIHGIGWGTRRPGALPPVGPCITGIIDLRETRDVAQGFVIEEGSIPGALGPLLPSFFSFLAEVAGPGGGLLARRLGERLTWLKSVVEGPYHGAVDKTQTFLVMAHDGSEGQMTLAGDRLQISWPGVGKEPIFKTVNDRLAQVSVGLGGTFVKDPIWSKPLGQSLVSVHPLGGCVMAESAAAGVVNHKGQVFRSAAGDAVYDSLYVTDGSIVPLSLGVNPLLTISALSERAMRLLAKDRGWPLDLTLPSRPRQVAAPAPAVAGIRFTETMRGFFSTVVKDDYAAAEKQGREADSAMEFTLTIQADDVNAMIDQPEHAAWIVGTVAAAALSAKPLAVVEGTFNLFVGNVAGVDVRNMDYRMQLASEEGKSFYFEGFKKVAPSSLLELWPQTTTLYVTVHDGKDATAPVLGKGILHIAAADFLRQMTTMKVTGAVDLKQQLAATARFGRFFAGVLYRAYGGILVPDTYFNPDAQPRKQRPLRAGAPELHPFKTSDGVELLLTRYQGGSKGPVLLVHGAGVSSRIFSTDLPETNLLEFLYAHGYDVWLFDFRASIALPASLAQSNGDQVATIDHPQAVALVRQLTGAPTIQAVVHCYGANTFFMAMLAGLQGVRSIVCSQIATNLETKLETRLKSGLHMPNLLDRLGVKSLTAYVDSHADWKSRIYDEVLRFNPLPEAEQHCHSAVCHRITFMYSLLYQHQQLSQPIHDNLHELFGVSNMATFEHLALMVDRQQVVAHDGQDVYMPHLERLALPIRFIHGAENQCYLPASTQLTLDLLAASNGERLYSRHVIPGYGHIDCIFGKDAAQDVYPLMLEHLEQT